MNAVRTPWQVALETLLKMGLREGDTIREEQITTMLTPAHPLSRSGAATLASRKSQIEALVHLGHETDALIAEFEGATGLSLIATGYGQWIVIRAEEVESARRERGK